MRISIGLLAILGFLLRYHLFMDKPLWIDEVIFLNIAKSLPYQEIIPALIQKLFNFQQESLIRLQFVLAGTLTIPAIYWVCQNKKLGLLFATIIAVFPLFVFWSTVARPYAFAGLFVVLSWKYRYLMIPAILTTPISILGWQIRKNYRELFVLLCVLGVTLALRRDTDKNFFNLEFLINAKRLWYIPILSGMLYIDLLTNLLLRSQNRFWRNIRRVFRIRPVQQMA